MTTEYEGQPAAVDGEGAGRGSGGCITVLVGALEEIRVYAFDAR
jgi:hypothetical protein